MVKKKFCSFPIRVTKAWVDSTTNLKMIEAVASDDKLDWYRERFAISAIDDMVYASRQKSKLKPEEGFVALQESHWEVFSMGYATDGERVSNPEYDSEEFKVVLALKAGWPKADELYKDTQDKRIDKQLSVGGYIPDWDEDYEVVDETFTNEDNEEVEIRVGVIKKFQLEHIAVTPPDGAANPRTRFETAKSKDFGYENGSVYKSANDESYQKRFEKKNKPEEASTDKVFKKFLSEFKTVMKDVVNEVFGEREDDVKMLEKAKKMIEELRKLAEDNPAELNDEAFKSLGFNFVSEDEPNIEEVIKTKLDAFAIKVDEKLETLKGTIPEKVELPEIPVDQTEKIKSIEELITAMDVRLKAVEDEVPEVIPEVVEEEVEEEEEEVEVIPVDKDDDLAPWR